MSDPRNSDTCRRASDLGRRELLAYAATFGTAFLARQGLVQAEDAEPAERRSSARRPAAATR